MTWRVEQIEEATAIFELQYGGGDADPTGLFNRHPIGGGVAAIAFGTHGTGRVDGTSIEQELLGEGGLAGIGMRDDGKGPPASDLSRESGVGGVARNRRIGDGLGGQGYSNELSGRGDYEKACCVTSALLIVECGWTLVNRCYMMWQCVSS